MNLRMIAAIMFLYIAAAEKIELEFMKFAYLEAEAIVFQENKYMILFIIGIALMILAVIPLDREDNL